MKVCVNFHILQMVSSLLANVFAIRLSYFLPKTVLFFFFWCSRILGEGPYRCAANGDPRPGAADSDTETPLLPYGATQAVA